MAGDAVTKPDDWQPAGTLPPNPRQTTYIHVRSVTSYRWLPYKPTSEQRRRGIMGRWQVATEYGWENAKLPDGEWMPVPDEVNP